MNLTAFLQLMQLIFSLIPAIVEAMQSVEKAMGNLPGAQKLEVVRTGLQSVWAAQSSVTHTFDEVWPSISGLIAQLKKTDLFKPTEAVQPVAQ